MIWCLLGPAAMFTVLGIATLTLDLRRIRPPRLSPLQALRGCLAGSLLLVAVLLAALATLVTPWPQ